MISPSWLKRTRTCREATQFVASRVALSIHVQSMENAQAAAIWLGTERHWSTASHGIVCERIVFGETANPVFVIEEIDKAPPHAQYNPLAAFHSLLAPLTACALRDAGLDVTFDTSLAIYIANSNDAVALPESLRSRVRDLAPAWRAGATSGLSHCHRGRAKASASLASRPRSPRCRASSPT
ncbi:hypothetical protein [Variovorax sp. HW608]|uniref:hypothetical protein n=1 Tax=Variovorax sp. HW608 TaxID=1034889 RepID=UPI000B5AD6D3|nr:hypothetical protein [Variovorax sp. HW608]